MDLTFNVGEASSLLDQVAQVAQIVLGVASAAIAILAIRLSIGVARTQNRISSSSTRAFVFARVSVNAFTVGQNIGLLLNVEHYGQTPALDVRIGLRTYVCNRGDTDAAFPLTISDSAASLVMFPGGSTPIKAALLSPSTLDEQILLTQALYDQVLRREKEIWTAAVIEYVDHTGQAHRTRVRSQIDPKSLVGGGAPTTSFRKGCISIS